jgi:hypothetical protein
MWCACMAAAAGGCGSSAALHDLDAHQLRGDRLAQVASSASNSSKASVLYSFSGSRWA